MTHPDQSDRPELETVASHDDVADFGIPVSLDEIGATVAVEREFLTALVWAPGELTTSIVRALVGDGRLAAHAPLFYLPGHGEVFRLVVESVDAAAPLAPADLARHFTDPRATAPFRNLLMEIASPNPAGPWPLPTDADLPALAQAVVDQWHRRGYQALLERMGTVLAEERNDDLGAHWEALSLHQRTAERTRAAVLDALGGLTVDPAPS
ncbi:hypothetical protein C6V83_04185 [Gordonia iterans]|uniref:Uncharacterized protein n=1 Tax=Gordonia iterans TaxID=1004901 RepID=A0A2S0KD40_9ACTN|nr:hypothetical protein [Gordonia iterans]AVL99598.1 hypothetical protein C6V83_04185 [Gordonia iterans]